MDFFSNSPSVQFSHPGIVSGKKLEIENCRNFKLFQKTFHWYVFLKEFLEGVHAILAFCLPNNPLLFKQKFLQNPEFLKKNIHLKCFFFGNSERLLFLEYLWRIYFKFWKHNLMKLPRVRKELALEDLSKETIQEHPY